jgi:hypothetical protein
MQKELLQTKWTLIAGLLLAFPAAYFLLANVLNSEIGLNWLWKPIEPIFKKPENKRFGWNVNMLIVFGPLLATLLNALSLIYFRFEKTGEYFQLQLFIKRKWWNIAVMIVAVGILVCLGTYLLLENLSTAKAFE